MRIAEICKAETAAQAEYDRWRPNEKLTVNAGLRLEYFPLMSRATHGIEVLDYNTYMVRIGGLGGVPQDAGLKLQTWYWEPRLGAAYRLNEKNAVRAGYGINYNAGVYATIARPLRTMAFGVVSAATAPAISVRFGAPPPSTSAIVMLIPFSSFDYATKISCQSPEPVEHPARVTPKLP